MDAENPLEKALARALALPCSSDCPPRLAEALQYSVCPGGARVRPKLVLAVAQACGGADMNAALSGASAIEMLHCASLVHDDLPCFDAAAYRRGKPSVHVAFGERLAVLAGDTLIVEAFNVVAAHPDMIRIIAQAVGAPHGICAGQAWECEDRMDLVRYQRAKTGALFAACTMLGAVAAGRDAAPWRQCGMLIGEAFQVADDLRDVAGVSGEIGKPTGQDAANGLPNMVSTLGFDGAMHHLENLLARVTQSTPDCPGREALNAQIVAVSRALVPKQLHRGAA
ncbi:MAG: polyprenyl synthetase family protein [Rhizobiales bacterium]|nr:polyprenyl synthetase family protein [Hyphomicrobiales bacterium]